MTKKESYGSPPALRCDAVPTLTRATRLSSLPEDLKNVVSRPVGQSSLAVIGNATELEADFRASGCRACLQQRILCSQPSVSCSRARPSLHRGPCRKLNGSEFARTPIRGSHTSYSPNSFSWLKNCCLLDKVFDEVFPSRALNPWSWPQPVPRCFVDHYNELSLANIGEPWHPRSIS